MQCWENASWRWILLICFKLCAKGFVCTWWSKTWNKCTKREWNKIFQSIKFSPPPALIVDKCSCGNNISRVRQRVDYVLQGINIDTWPGTWWWSLWIFFFSLLPPPHHHRILVWWLPHQILPFAIAYASQSEKIPLTILLLTVRFCF